MQALRKQVESRTSQPALRPPPPTTRYSPRISGAKSNAPATLSGTGAGAVPHASGLGSPRVTSLPPTNRNGHATGPSATRQRTHTVKQFETPAAIARSYGVRLDALLAANPGVDPRKLKVGQTLNLPDL